MPIKQLPGIPTLKQWQDSKTGGDAYDLIVKITGSGPFDGGCVYVALALQSKLGPRATVCVLTDKNDLAQHAVACLGNLYFDWNGKATAEGMLKRFAKDEHCKVTAIRPIAQYGDLTDARRGMAKVKGLADLLPKQMVD